MTGVPLEKALDQAQAERLVPDRRHDEAHRLADHLLHRLGGLVTEPDDAPVRRRGGRHHGGERTVAQDPQLHLALDLSPRVEQAAHALLRRQPADEDHVAAGAGAGPGRAGHEVRL